jgi:predicted nucleotidyltransferase
MPSRRPRPTIEQVTELVVPILIQHGATRAGLFGSLVHGNLRTRSDIDILVELPRTLSLVDVIGIQQELEDSLGRKVDLVQYDAIKPLLREPILREEVPIL